MVELRHTESVMGTVVSFALCPHPLTTEQVNAALEEACRVLHEADQLFSRYKPESMLNRYREERLSEHPIQLEEIIAYCEKAQQLSQGHFNPWFNGAFDPTGLVKGWAVERAAQVFQAAGFQAGLVNGAGDICLFGQPDPERGWQVALTDPRQLDRFSVLVNVTQAIATSGRSQLPDHILDKQARPARGVISASVVGPELVLADAYATALVAEGNGSLSWLDKLSDYQARIELDDGRIISSSEFPALL